MACQIGRERGEKPNCKIPFSLRGKFAAVQIGAGGGEATTIVGRKGKRGKRAHEKEISFPEKKDSAGGGREGGKGGSDAFLFPPLSPPSTTLPFPPRESATFIGILTVAEEEEAVPGEMSCRQKKN